MFHCCCYSEKTACWTVGHCGSTRFTIMLWRKTGLFGASFLLLLVITLALWFWESFVIQGTRSPACEPKTLPRTYLSFIEQEQQQQLQQLQQQLQQLQQQLQAQQSQHHHSTQTQTGQQPPLASQQKPDWDNKREEGVLTGHGAPSLWKDLDAFFSSRKTYSHAYMEPLSEYKHRRWQWYHHDILCSDKRTTNERRTWATAMTNDKYVTPAIALAHSIRKFSCEESMIAMVSSEVSLAGREALSKVGWKVFEKPVLDCAHEGQQVEGVRAIAGSHMRLHYWNMTEFDRYVYLDCDIILMDNIDELFYLPLQSTGVIYAAPFEPNGEGINSGLLVFKPSVQVYHAMLANWRSKFPDDCMYDQLLISKFFKANGRAIERLPYSFNVRRQRYHPTRLYHMAGQEKFKAWLNPMPRASAQELPIMNVPAHITSLWWYIFYDALDTYGLNDWWDAQQMKAH
ncbi:Glycogenin-1 [Balamuthia mandrillaris]